MSRSKLERELKHLRESLHEAHRELAIKADRIEELDGELKRYRNGEAAPKPREVKSQREEEGETRKETAGEKVAHDERSEENLTETCLEPAREIKTSPMGSGEVSTVTIVYRQNSAVNFEGREQVLQFVRKQLREHPATLFSVSALANDSEFIETTHDIAHNRARFLVDYLTIQGVSDDVFAEVTSEVSSESGDKGRKIVVSALLDY